MIIDCHTHLIDPDRDLTDAARADMRRCGIDLSQWRNLAERHLETTAVADAAIVFGLRARAAGWTVPNDAIAAHVRRDPGRLIGFGAVDPSESDPLQELERCHQELKFQGLKLAPVYQDVHPLDPRIEPLYAYCRRHGLPIMIHMAATFATGAPLETARPAHIDTVACRHPDLTLIMPHMGHPWEGETIAVIRRHPNVYADVSALYYRPWQFYNSMRLLTEYRAWNKVLFGSDFPFTTTADSIAGIKNVNAVLGASGLPPVPQTVIDEILYRDTIRVLQLETNDNRSMQPSTDRREGCR